jgi:hypothetical protein
MVMIVLFEAGVGWAFAYLLVDHVIEGARWFEMLQLSILESKQFPHILDLLHQFA